MNLEKVIKIFVPVFVLAIVSRSFEEISFFYYGVPVMCLVFIVLLFISSKSNGTKEQLELNDSDSEQVGMTDSEPLYNQSQQGRHSGTTKTLIGIKKLPSTIIHQPFTIYLLPGLWFLFTSLWSSYPEISAIRALYFILISLGCVSAGILWIRLSGKNIFDFLVPANAIVILLCLFSLLTNIPSDSWTGGHGKGFMGFFGHQNLLASVLLFTLPSVFIKLLQPVKSDKLSAIRNTRQKLFSNKSLLSTYYLPLTTYYLLLTANLLVLTLTYSRSAILSLIFGVLVFLILNKNWKILSYSFVIAAVITSTIYFTPAANNFADTIIKKDFPEFYSSRFWLWEPSYNAALEGGMFGIGYGISHPEIRSGEYSDHFENGRLIREKGNSVLALIEETGLIGLFLFIAPILLIVILSVTKDLNQIRFFSRQNGIRMTTDNSLLTTNYALLTAAIAAFLLHAQFEAWLVGVGSVQLPLFYIYLGLLVQGWKAQC